MSDSNTAINVFVISVTGYKILHSVMLTRIFLYNSMNLEDILLEAIICITITVCTMYNV